MICSWIRKPVPVAVLGCCLILLPFSFKTGLMLKCLFVIYLTHLTLKYTNGVLPNHSVQNKWSAQNIYHKQLSSTKQKPMQTRRKNTFSLSSYYIWSLTTKGGQSCFQLGCGIRRWWKITLGETWGSNLQKWKSPYKLTKLQKCYIKSAYTSKTKQENKTYLVRRPVAVQQWPQNGYQGHRADLPTADPPRLPPSDCKSNA